MIVIVGRSVGTDERELLLVQVTKVGLFYQDVIGSGTNRSNSTGTAHRAVLREISRKNAEMSKKNLWVWVENIVQ